MNLRSSLLNNITYSQMAIELKLMARILKEEKNEIPENLIIINTYAKAASAVLLVFTIVTA